MSKRALTLFCHTGLSNRLYVLTSGLALSAATGREFRMLWPRTAACGAAFQELFANDWPVEEVNEQTLANLPYGWSRYKPTPPDLLTASAETITMGAHHTLVRPDIYPGHAALVKSCLDYFGQLQPIPAIVATVTEFMAHRFRPVMIGVHLRRGDYMMIRPDMMENTSQAIAAVEAALLHTPEAGIFLATDDDAEHGKGVRATFARRFADRVIWTTPRSLDRNSVAAVQDGLVDLWLLRQTGHVIGSAGSAFSRLAVYGRTVPYTFCRGASPGYHRAVWLHKLTGVYWLVRWLGRREFQRDLPFPTLLHFYRSAPQRLIHSALRRRPAPNGESCQHNSLF